MFLHKMYLCFPPHRLPTSSAAVCPYAWLEAGVGRRGGVGCLCWSDVAKQVMGLFLREEFLPVLGVLELMGVQIIKEFGCHSP